MWLNLYFCMKQYEGLTFTNCGVFVFDPGFMHFFGLLSIISPEFQCTFDTHVNCEHHSLIPTTIKTLFIDSIYPQKFIIAFKRESIFYAEHVVFLVQFWENIIKTVTKKTSRNVWKRLTTVHFFTFFLLFQRNINDLKVLLLSVCVIKETFYIFLGWWDDKRHHRLFCLFFLISYIYVQVKYKIINNRFLLFSVNQGRETIEKVRALPQNKSFVFCYDFKNEMHLKWWQSSLNC